MLISSYSVEQIRLMSLVFMRLKIKINVVILWEISNFCINLTRFHLRNNFVFTDYNKSIDMRVILKYSTNEHKLFICNIVYIK